MKYLHLISMSPVPNMNEVAAKNPAGIGISEFIRLSQVCGILYELTAASIMEKRNIHLLFFMVDVVPHNVIAVPMPAPLSPSDPLQSPLVMIRPPISLGHGFGDGKGEEDRWRRGVLFRLATKEGFSG